MYQIIKTSLTNGLKKTIEWCTNNENIKQFDTKNYVI